MEWRKADSKISARIHQSFVLCHVLMQALNTTVKHLENLNRQQMLLHTLYKKQPQYCNIAPL